MQTGIYDVVIVGTGPCGIFTAYELLENRKLSIFLVDAGDSLENKHCHLENYGSCRYCPPACHIISGFGGSQFFQGTKLSRWPAGTNLLRFHQDLLELEGHYDTVDNVFQQFGVPERYYPDQEEIKKWVSKFREVGIKYKYYNSQKISKSQMNTVAKGLQQTLVSKGAAIGLCEVVKDIERNSWGFRIKTSKREVAAKRVVFATGRLGARWLSRLALKLGLRTASTRAQKIEFGVRIEMPYRVFEELDGIHNDIKLISTLEDGSEIRSFCQNYRGYITKCVYNALGNKLIATLDGHIIGNGTTSDTLSDTTNLAIHHRVKYNGDIDSVYDYIGKMNHAGKPIAQRLKNFINNEAVEFDPKTYPFELTCKEFMIDNLNNYFPEKTTISIKNFIMKVDRILPGFADDSNVVYGPCFELGWLRFELSEKMETNVRGLYIGGDATGHFRGAMQACISGFVIGKSILSELS